jgi:micrococcal nuclease
MNKILSFILLITLSCQSYANSFNAKYIKNYDGDTITVDLNCDTDFFCKDVKVRLFGLDTPEIRTKDKCEKAKGYKAKQFVKDRLSNASNIELKDCAKGKYFRLVCNIIYDGKNLSKELLRANLAYSYFGGTKQKINWCDNVLE